METPAPQTAPEKVTAAELMQWPLFGGESEETVEWIASLMEVVRYQRGDTMLREGEEIRHFSFLLEGEVQFRRDGDPHRGILARSAGQAFGILPFSRLKTSPARGVAIEDCRVAMMEASHLHDLVYRAPLVAQRLVSEMTDRTREATRYQEGASKLLALGKLAAGLAHELNNPASAAVRSASRLREILLMRRTLAIELRAHELSDRAQAIFAAGNQAILDCAESPGLLDALERDDMESQMSDWLDSIGVPSELASGLTDARITIDILHPLAGEIPANVFELVVRILIADHDILCLSREVEESCRRISDLVQTVKRYSYMDQSAVTDVDIAEGIDSTLRMFQHQLKQGIEVERQFDGNLPRVRGNGGALNQIWTNLIDNAIDAMQNNPPDRPRILRVRTCSEPQVVLVEISDTGPGIPEDIQSMIFDPFFTTKPVGEGTGLGLDIVQRIVRQHKGIIRLNSAPGKTLFQIRLPI